MLNIAADKTRIFLLLVMWLTFRATIAPSGQVFPPDAREYQNEGCTIGVASASVTADGRPLLWKIRDNSELPHNSVSYETSFPHRFVAVTNSGDDEVWMGVNESGFAIINSTSLDLPGRDSGFSNGRLMQYALGTCSRVDEFIRLLDSTNGGGRRTRGNFGVIDASGSAMMFEVSGTWYWGFDANDSDQSPNGYILRTNFSLTGGGTTGIERYRRAIAQIGEFRSGDTLDYRRIIRYHARDLSDQNSNQLPVPYPKVWTPGVQPGYVYSNTSVCRFKSLSAAAITGVAPGEPTMVSTMWLILGQPAAGIAVPYWPVGEVPLEAAGSVTAPLYEVATEIRSLLFDCSLGPDYIDSYKLRDDCGNGLWASTFPAEDSILNAAEKLLGNWRREAPTPKRILKAEYRFASYARSEMQGAYERLQRRVAISVANSTAYKDKNNETLANGDIVQLIWAGEDGLVDPPDMDAGSPRWGLPTNDDQLIGVPHLIGENASQDGSFLFQFIGWADRTDGFPSSGDRVYVRAFNSNTLEHATRYGDAQTFVVSLSGGSPYDPLIEGGQTHQPLQRLLANNDVSSRFGLYPNFPNPFNASTIIEFETPYAQGSSRPVEVSVFNALGETVKKLYAGVSAGGYQRLEWDGRDAMGQAQPSGVYFVRLRDGPMTRTQKMMLLK